MNGSVSITWNKYTRVLECTLESRSRVSDRPMHPSQLGDRPREGPGRGFIRCVEDQEAFITYHSVTSNSFLPYSQQKPGRFKTPESAPPVLWICPSPPPPRQTELPQFPG